MSNEEHADEDRDGEGNVGRNSSNGEKGTGGHGAGKDEKGESDADNGVKPYGIDRGLGALVHALNPGRSWQAVVAGVRKSYAGGGDLRKSNMSD